MVTFIRCEDKQGVALIDSGGLEVGKKFAEGGVVITELLHVGSFAGAKSFFGAEAGAFLIVVGVGDVGKDDRNAFLEHGLDYGKCLGRHRIEIYRAESGNRISVVIGKAAKRGRYILEAKQRFITGVPSRLAGQRIRYRIVCGAAKLAANGAVNGRANEIIGLAGA